MKSKRRTRKGFRRTPVSRKASRFRTRQAGNRRVSQSAVGVQSDFTKPTGWDEEHSDKVKVFRLDGYYYIAVYDGPYLAWFFPPLIMDDFRVHVDADLNIQTGIAAECGIVFCERKENGEARHCMFAISSLGYFHLVSSAGNKISLLIHQQESGLIKSGDRTNALMVERIGQKVTLGINGQSITTVVDWVLRAGI